MRGGSDEWARASGGRLELLAMALGRRVLCSCSCVDEEADSFLL